MNKIISMELFTEELLTIISELFEKESDNIKEAAKLCAEAVAENGVIQVMGSGHSIGFGLEMRDRAGSLVPVHSIKMDDFVLTGKIDYATYRSQDVIFERTPGIADQLYAMYDIQPKDVFIIISNSGINGVVIDLALHAKEQGHKIIVVTSWQHTSAEDSRHPSGKKLYQLGDVVIDNCGPQGDALIKTNGKEKICSISSITGAYIAQTIGSETCEFLLEKGKELPVLWPENKEGYLEHNLALLDKYKGRI